MASCGAAPWNKMKPNFCCSGEDAHVPLCAGTLELLS